MFRTDPDSEFHRAFGDFESAERKDAWQTVVESLEIGETVTGIVVLRQPYGVWIDIGVGFPALLLIVMMLDLDHKTYIADEWCPVGSQVTANIRIVNGRQIGLEQFPYDELIKSNSRRLISASKWWQFWRK